MSKQCKHRKTYYTCKRMRLLQHLVANGFTPQVTIPDPQNPIFSWWLFENTPELEEVIEKYFADLQERKKLLKI